MNGDAGMGSGKSREHRSEQIISEPVEAGHGDGARQRVVLCRQASLDRQRIRLHLLKRRQNGQARRRRHKAAWLSFEQLLLCLLLEHIEAAAECRLGRAQSPRRRAQRAVACQQLNKMEFFPVHRHLRVQLVEAVRLGGNS
ncbi:hypothetical protein D9M68_768260 [compost metagenome]